MAARRPDAELVGVLGARGHGKSLFFREWIGKRRPNRLGIWDVKREHGLQSTADIGEYIRWMKAARWLIAFHPDMHDAKRRALQFDLFCRAHYLAKHNTCGVEELAFSTSPSWSPEAWKTLSLLGRDENPEGGAVSVIASSQRPAQIDKHFIGNCTLLHVAKLPYEADAATVAKTLGVPMSDLMTLPKLAWIERGENDTSARRGTISLPAAAPKAPKVKEPKGTHPKGAELSPEAE